MRAVLLLAFSCVSLLAEHVLLFVSPRGDDAGRGSIESPFRTLERARDALRNRNPAQATVFLRGGTYLLSHSFQLSSQDRNVTYKPYQHEPVRLIGGRILKGFHPVQDPAALPRLSPAARPHVLECDLRAQGIADFGTFRSRGQARPVAPSHLELFFDRRRMTVARWPNHDFARIAGPGEPAPKDDQHGGRLGRLEAGFLYDGDRPARWQSTDNVWVHGYWAWDWANSYEQVASIDTARRLVRTLPPYGIYGIRAGQRYYFLNILEELDEPGEYYLDRSSGKLYFWPPAPIDSAEVAVSLLETPLIELHDAQNIAIEGLTLEYARAHGILVEGGSQVRISGCVLRNLGNYGVVVRGGTRHTVAGCDIYQTGDGGIELHGGDRRSLTASGHTATDNHIHHYAEWSKTYQPGILMTGVGQRAAHNLIHDAPHNGILINGNEHVTEFNEIHHVCLETGDVGAFYIGRDYSERGNIVRHNFFHHTGGVGMGSMGVYLDDCASGTTIFGNVFYKVTRAAFIGGGRDNTVENNIFVDCEPAVDLDARGLSPSPVWHDMIYKTMRERLEQIGWRQPPYSTRYPELARLEKYYAADAGVPPEGNRVRHNIVKGANAANGKWLAIRSRATRDMIDVGENLTTEDPLFVNQALLNFQLRPDSPAYKLGFRRIPFEEIGPRRGRYHK
jgi:hypothetical protein